MGTFYDVRKDKIAGFVADSMANALQDMLSGRKPSSSPTYGAEQHIEGEFRSFLDANEMTTLAIGLGRDYLAAAARGVSHRKKHPYAKRGPRPAFIDTGTYRMAFRAIVKL
ncbi:MAG: hypothetical protein ACREML_12495, partial [Vulcanimicrobiaceae bacterium]